MEKKENSHYQTAYDTDAAFAATGVPARRSSRSIQSNALPDTGPNQALHSEASLGDASWLIYRWRLESNPALQEAWPCLAETKTKHGFDGRVFVNEQTKQIVIVCEGTQSDEKGGSTWISKDGWSDLQIGLKYIPTQTKEGYAWFKEQMAAVTAKYGSEYGITLAGHSLGGGNAQLLAGMYYLDTGRKVPTLAEAGPGMLPQLKNYMYDQLMAGNTVYLPDGSTTQLSGGAFSYFQRKSQAEKLSNALRGDDFAYIVNFITPGDPVGNIGYNSDAALDKHVGVSLEAPYILTPREDMQDAYYESKKDSMNNKTTPNLPWFLSDFSHLYTSRFDRHQPEQSYATWSGNTVGILKDHPADDYDYQAPIKLWEGSRLSLPERQLCGQEGADVLQGSSADELLLGQNGDDRLYGGDGGDILGGGAGNDWLYGDAGDDYLSGGDGNDQLFGGSGNDILYGGNGDDWLDGGSGSDLLSGGSGNDTLVWSGGNDLLLGNEGNDAFLLGDANQQTTGRTTLKWERNFGSFGQDTVSLLGMNRDNASTHLTFSFADEIKLSDLRFNRQGSDIYCQDTKSSGSVLFQNAMESFAAYSGQLDFLFTNGRLYKDDQRYQVVSGSGTLSAASDSEYQGHFFLGSAGADTLYAGSGNSLLFGGEGSDSFIFDGYFGQDRIADGSQNDAIRFGSLFDSQQFTLQQSGSDLLLSYPQNGAASQLTLSNWYSASDHITDFYFGDNSRYTIQNNHFMRVSA